jgi:hypothetical protein
MALIMTQIWCHLSQCIIECIDDVLLKGFSIHSNIHLKHFHMGI